MQQQKKNNKQTNRLLACLPALISLTNRSVDTLAMARSMQDSGKMKQDDCCVISHQCNCQREYRRHDDDDDDVNSTCARMRRLVAAAKEIRHYEGVNEAHRSTSTINGILPQQETFTHHHR